MYDINFQSFIDSDHSPFILFDKYSKILYLNNSAEILLGYVDKKELYDMALQYAPQSFGVKTTTLNLNYECFSFYAITVGYECEEQIYIRLYHTPKVKQNIKLDTNKLILTDINLLLEANITLFKSRYNTSLTLLTDPDIPKFKLDQNRFSKLLRKTFELFGHTQEISIILKFLVGEHIIIDNKRYHIIHLGINSNTKIKNSSDISTIAKECFVSATIYEKSVILKIPLLID
jgi:hypothetical protein